VRQVNHRTRTSKNQTKYFLVPAVIVWIQSSATIITTMSTNPVTSARIARDTGLLGGL